MSRAKCETKNLKANMKRLQELQKKNKLSQAEEIEKLELQTRIAIFLNSLNVLLEEERQIVTLRIEHVTIKDIATMTGYSKTGIWNKLDRIYKKLEKLL